MTGSTTKLVLPYPTGTDPLSAGDDMIKSLAERIEARMPWGWLAYAQAVANQAGMAATAFTGLSLALTLPAGRRIRVSGFVNPASAVAGVWGGVEIRDNGVVVATCYQVFSNNSGVLCAPVAYLSPAAGAHTYTLQSFVSSSTITNIASATAPSFIMAEDVGPQSLT